MFETAAFVLVESVDVFFVPREMTLNSAVPHNVCRNDDTAALFESLATGKRVWIHGSQSVAYKDALRERVVSECIVSDIVPPL